MLVQKFYQIILLPYLDIIGYTYIYIYCNLLYTSCCKGYVVAEACSSHVCPKVDLQVQRISHARLLGSPAFTKACNGASWAINSTESSVKGRSQTRRISDIAGF